MSLPNKALFNRYCELNIAGTLFTYPPFSIEFEQNFTMNQASTTMVKLYNPNSSTIKKAEGKKEGDTQRYPVIEIIAGYVNDYGLVCKGEINNYKVYRKGVDTILELSVGDMTGDIANGIIGKTYNNMNMANIAKDLIKMVGKTAEVNVPGAVNVKSFTADTFDHSIKNLAVEMGAQYFIKNDVVHVELPEQRKPQVAFISPTSGLLGGIEKDSKGYKFRTLFLYKVQIGDVVQIKDNAFDATYVQIVEGKKSFSSFGNSECEFKAVAV